MSLVKRPKRSSGSVRMPSMTARGIGRGEKNCQLSRLMGLASARAKRSSEVAASATSRGRARRERRSSAVMMMPVSAAKRGTSSRSVVPGVKVRARRKKRSPRPAGHGGVASAPWEAASTAATPEAVSAAMMAAGSPAIMAPTTPRVLRDGRSRATKMASTAMPVIAATAT